MARKLFDMINEIREDEHLCAWDWNDNWYKMAVYDTLWEDFGDFDDDYYLKVGDNVAETFGYKRFKLNYAGFEQEDCEKLDPLEGLLTSFFEDNKKTLFSSKYHQGSLAVFQNKDTKEWFASLFTIET